MPPSSWMQSSVHSVARSAAYRMAPAQSWVRMVPASSTLALDELVVGDGLSELLALVGEGQGHVEGGLHDAEGTGGQNEALEIEALHEHAHAAVEFAEDAVVGHEDGVKAELARVAAAHAHLVELALAAEAVGRLGLDDEGGDALGAGVGLGFGVDDNDVGVGPVCDPHLAAVDEVAAVDLFGRRAHADDVAAGARLGHGEGADARAGNEAGQVLLLLLGVAVELQLVDAELGVGGVAEADGARGARQLLHDDAVGLVAHGEATDLLVGRDAQEAGLAQLGPHVVGEGVGLVCAGGDLLGHFAAREVLHALAQLGEVGLGRGLEALGVFLRVMPRLDLGKDGGGGGGCRDAGAELAGGLRQGTQ
ncbi:hypothetical protein VDGD_20868 [Verticillium dahliae]|nr:hypothetical protein VDGD_20868 [Verticillium dahliae]